jgi:membrane-associated phospholipid phosphatase
MRWLLWLNQHFAGRLLTAVAVITATFQVYGWLNDRLPPRYDLSTPLDAAIPFLPWTHPLYMSFFLLLMVAAWQLDAREFVRMLGAVLVMDVVCFLGFVLFTAHYPRPDVESIASPYWREEFRWMWSRDRPGNTFPSLHVAATVLGTLRLRRRRGGNWWGGWAALICVSTLTVKQHFIVDVLGGIAVALAVHAVVFREGTPPAPGTPLGQGR